MQINFILIKNTQDLAIHKDFMLKVLPIHQLLRTQFSDFSVYFEQMHKVLADNAQLMVAEIDTQIVGVAVFRIFHNTYQHKVLFLDDLVVAETVRGEKIGTSILQKCEQIALDNDCHYLSLDSGVQRGRAHKFYYLHDYIANSLHFVKALKL